MCECVRTHVRVCICDVCVCYAPTAVVAPHVVARCRSIGGRPSCASETLCLCTRMAHTRRCARDCTITQNNEYYKYIYIRVYCCIQCTGHGACMIGPMLFAGILSLADKCAEWKSSAITRVNLCVCQSKSFVETTKQSLDGAAGAATERRIPTAAAHENEARPRR